jgi:hypothetical protein
MKPRTPPHGHEAFVADALREAMLLRDGHRCIEIGKIAAELVAVEIEQARRHSVNALHGAPASAKR